MNDLEFCRRVTKWYHAHGRDLPWRHTKDPYRIWVSEIMLQQTQVDTVKPYYLRFISRLPGISDLARAEDDLLFKLWEGLGYYRRIRHMKEAAIQIMNEHDGRFPDTYDAIIGLKGIGAYTAAAIASIAFDRPNGVIDGNTLRILSRVDARTDNIALARTKKVFQARMDGLIAVSREDDPVLGGPSSFNQAMMDLGAMICVPRKPACDRCPVGSLCEARKAGREGVLPVNIKNTAKSDIYFITAILKKGDRYFMIKNEKDGLLQGLYGFVQYEVESPVSFEEAFYEEYGLNVRLTEYVKEVRHVFSHRVWHMNVYYGEITDEARDHLYTAREVLSLPVSTAHQKVARAGEERLLP